MRRQNFRPVVVVLCFLISTYVVASGADPADERFPLAEDSWTDQFGETTYGMVLPDSVGVGELFDATITVRDPFYPEDMVAAPWSFLLDGGEEDGGFAIFLADTAWESVYSFAFDSAGVHDFVFTAQDLGHGNGAHSWEWFEIPGTVYVTEPSSGLSDHDLDLAPALYFSAPNPFHTRTLMRFDLARPGISTLTIHDVSGRAVRTLAKTSARQAGLHTVTWDGRDDSGRELPAGIYFYELKVNGRSTDRKKTTLVR